jgi:hypothetical protein
MQQRTKWNRMERNDAVRITDTGMYLLLSWPRSSTSPLEPCAWPPFAAVTFSLSKHRLRAIWQSSGILRGEVSQHFTDVSQMRIASIIRAFVLIIETVSTFEKSSSSTRPHGLYARRMSSSYSPQWELYRLSHRLRTLLGWAENIWI